MSDELVEQNAELRARVARLEGELETAKASILQLTDKYTEADNLVRASPTLFRVVRLIKQFRFR